MKFCSRLRLRAPRLARPRRRHAAALRVRARAARSTTRTRRSSSAASPTLGGRGAAVPARDRAAARAVDAAGGLPGERRDASSPARCARRSRRRSARVDVGELYTVISLPQISQVYMMFRATLVDLDFGPGPRASRCACSTRTTSRGSALAFRTIARTLRNFFLDRKRRRVSRCACRRLERRPPLPPDLRGAA